MNDDSKTSIFRKESLERLSSPEQLDQLMQVVSPKSWLPLAALGSIIGLALIWSIFGRIPVTATGQGVLVHPTDSSDELVGLIYFRSGEGDRIQPGMEIIIIPNTSSSERVGGILARVKDIPAPLSVTLEAVRQSETLDATVGREGWIEVLAELERDPSTLSGYRWSSVAGSQLRLSPGTTTTARITLEEKAPITFVFPFLEVQ